MRGRGILCGGMRILTERVVFYGKGGAYGLRKRYFMGGRCTHTEGKRYFMGGEAAETFVTTRVLFGEAG